MRRGLQVICARETRIVDTPYALRIGVEHVALGSDFDGTEVPDELGDVIGVPALLEEFAKHGFSASEIEAIAWDNWRRTHARCWNEG